MINRLKIAIVNDDWQALGELANELECAINSGFLATLSREQLYELKGLNKEAIKVLEQCRFKDLSKIKKLKNSLKYLG